jgi:hypothetical protein
LGGNLAWGQRVTIIKKCKELITLMDGAPYDFIINHEEPDLKGCCSFKHRTFNDIDTLYFIAFLGIIMKILRVWRMLCTQNKEFAHPDDSEGLPAGQALAAVMNQRRNI